MKRKASVHINRSEQPGFDFLQTRSISRTPVGREKKEKKMFLSLYRSLQGHCQAITPKLIREPLEIKQKIRQESLMIQSLIPVPMQNRFSPRLSMRNQRKRTPLLCNRIKVNIQTRKSTPFSTGILDESLGWT